MKEGQVVKRLFIERKGKTEEIVVRFPKIGDASELWKYYNKAIKETEFLSRINPVGLSDERRWLAGVLIGIRKKNRAHLLAVCGGKIVGSCSVERQITDTTRHIGTYGIAILDGYKGYGLGRKMSDNVIALAKKELRLEMLQLSVYSRNTIAIGLYKKLGFRKIGSIPRGIKHGRRYMDNIIMCKALK